MTAAANQPQIPDETTAFNNLFYGVRNRAFFHKLASLGYAPQGPNAEKQAQDFLAMADELREFKQHPTVKQAAEAVDPIAAARRDLRTVLQQRGILDKEAADDAFADQAAAQFMENPDVFNSVLVMKAAEAQEVAVEHGLLQTA